MNRKYNYLHAIFMPFFSRSFYQDVALNWKGTAFGFLFLLLALCWIPITIIIIHSSHLIANEMVSSDLKFPAFTINKGQLSIDAPVPYVIDDPKTKKPVIIVDTSGRYTALSQTEAKVLITKTTAAIKDQQETRIYHFKPDLNFYMDQALLKQWIAKFIVFMSIFIFPFCLLFSFLYRMLEAVIYASIGNAIIDKFTKSGLPFDGILRLSVMAMVPPIIISTVLTCVLVSFAFEWLCYFILAMIYLGFGLSSVRKSLTVES